MTDFFYSRQLPGCVGKLYDDAIGCSLALREVIGSSNFNFLRRKTLEALELLLFNILINGFGDHAIRLSRDRVQEVLAEAPRGKRLKAGREHGRELLWRMEPWAPRLSPLPFLALQTAPS